MRLICFLNALRSRNARMRHLSGLSKYDISPYVVIRYLITGPDSPIYAYRTSRSDMSFRCGHYTTSIFLPSSKLNLDNRCAHIAILQVQFGCGTSILRIYHIHVIQYRKNIEGKMHIHSLIANCSKVFTVV